MLRSLGFLESIGAVRFKSSPFPVEGLMSRFASSRPIAFSRLVIGAEHHLPSLFVPYPVTILMGIGLKRSAFATAPT